MQSFTSGFFVFFFEFELSRGVQKLNVSDDNNDNQRLFCWFYFSSNSVLIRLAAQSSQIQLKQILS